MNHTLFLKSGLWQWDSIHVQDGWVSVEGGAESGDSRVLVMMENAAVQWDTLTGDGGLCTEQVGVGGELVIGRGVQYGMGWAAVQKRHLTLPDGGGGLVQGGGRGRRGWGEQTGWRRGREGATWRTHTHTHTRTHTHSGKSVLLYGVKPLLIDEILTK